MRLHVGQRSKVILGILAIDCVGIYRTCKGLL